MFIRQIGPGLETEHDSSTLVHELSRRDHFSDGPGPPPREMTSSSRARPMPFASCLKLAQMLADLDCMLLGPLESGRMSILALRGLSSLRLFGHKNKAIHQKKQTKKKKHPHNNNQKRKTLRNTKNPTDASKKNQQNQQAETQRTQFGVLAGQRPCHAGKV